MLFRSRSRRRARLLDSRAWARREIRGHARSDSCGRWVFWWRRLPGDAHEAVTDELIRQAPDFLLSRVDALSRGRDRDTTRDDETTRSCFRREHAVANRPSESGSTPHWWRGSKLLSDAGRKASFDTSTAVGPQSGESLLATVSCSPPDGNSNNWKVWLVEGVLFSLEFDRPTEHLTDVESLAVSVQLAP